MSESHKELLQMAKVLEQLIARGAEPRIRGPLEHLKEAAEEVGKASSGSWLGYHANVYYAHLRTPPAGANFNPEWGLMGTVFVPEKSAGDWTEHDPDQVSNLIYERAGNPNIKEFRDFDKLAGSEFSKLKSNLFSIIEIETGNFESQFLTDQKEAASKLSLISEYQYLESWKPRQVSSRDSTAMHQGIRIPPHARILAQVLSIETTMATVGSLTEIARQVASHISRQYRQPVPRSPQASRVFIGHGHSHLWRELKDFLQDKLGLAADEFNREPAAGMPIAGRLLAMLDSATIAFLVMTGEDEQLDGALRARENVVHEAGLFQGRLGFERAIVLLEEGCQKFSNNAGLVHINFPKNNIRAAFHDVREVLEREGVLETGTDE